MPLWLTLSFLLVIAILAGVAAYLHWKLHLQREQQKRQQRDYEAELNLQKQHAAESINIIARSYLAEQVDLAETSLRIHHLLQYFDLSDKEQSQVKVFEEISGRIAHIPILEEWNALDRKSRDKYRETLAAVEEEFDVFAKDASKHLLDMELLRR